VRDALVRGDFEKVPERYRDMVTRFLRWLQEHERRAPGH
jgi:hypothetical protein